jgi:hypothetical protein
MSYAHLYRHFCSQIVEIKFKKWKIWICVLLQVLLLVVVVVVLGGGMAAVGRSHPCTISGKPGRLVSDSNYWILSRVATIVFNYPVKRATKIV